MEQILRRSSFHLSQIPLLAADSYQRIAFPWKISLRTACYLTSAYFVHDGFISAMDSILGWLESFLTSSPQDTKFNGWRFTDGCLILFSGFFCVLGLEHGKLNFVRWPTLFLFVYKIFEYFLEKVYRFQEPHQSQLPRTEWTRHFLLPSIHIVIITIFLYRNQGRVGPPSLKKFKRKLNSVRKVRERRPKRGSSYSHLISQEGFNQADNDDYEDITDKRNGGEDSIESMEDTTGSASTSFCQVLHGEYDDDDETGEGRNSMISADNEDEIGLLMGFDGVLQKDEE